MTEGITISLDTWWNIGIGWYFVGFPGRLGPAMMTAEHLDASTSLPVDCEYNIG